ncbi:LOW QUALITY PROTEIN: myeloid cell nuclear differentiation antigen [Ovis canadensis]|uniref:LOW QUALITY PROTEIN: myeloid cell nuclear differentiation antigen n=1 Tax=Ovis canadensis TaxID=37174 RepID=UPI003753E54E
MTAPYYAYRFANYRLGSFSILKNQKTQGQCKITARRDVLQKGPKTVMALKATEPFEYESPEEEKSAIFHATVVTARQFFQLKVFNNLKKKFIKQKVITKSDYREYKEILEINKASSVSEVGLDQKFEVPNIIIKIANKFPRSDSLLKQASGIFVYGLFVLHQKKVNRKNTIYEIQASIGKMNVVGNGKWYNINCKEGDKLFCFQLRTIDQKLKLTSGKFLF